MEFVGRDYSASQVAGFIQSRSVLRRGVPGISQAGKNHSVGRGDCSSLGSRSFDGLPSVVSRVPTSSICFDGGEKDNAGYIADGF